MQKTVSTILSTKLPKFESKIESKFEKLPKLENFEVEDNVKNWIREFIGINSQVEKIQLGQIIQILEMLEEKMKNNTDKIIFYVEEGKEISNEISRKAQELQLGFVAKSFFVGILGSVVLECFYNKERLQFHIDNYYANSPKNNRNVEDFLYETYKMYRDYSLIFNTNEIFHTKIQYGTKVPYVIKEITTKLEDVVTWNVEKLIEVVL